MSRTTGKPGKPFANCNHIAAAVPKGKKGIPHDKEWRIPKYVRAFLVSRRQIINKN